MVHQCALSQAGGASSGANELAQFEYALSMPGAFRMQIHQHISQRHNYSTTPIQAVDGGQCLAFNITQSGGAGAGGSSFYVVALGQALQLCLVRDLKIGVYEVTCPAFPDQDGCISIEVTLGYEDYDAFFNHIGGGGPVGGSMGGGYRKPLDIPILRNARWCRRLLPAQHNSGLKHLLSPLMSCETAGQWIRSQDEDADANWWQTRWSWQRQCVKQSALQSVAAAASNTIFDASHFAQLHSLHFIGESHLLCLADCAAAELEREGRLVRAPWASLHRREPPTAWPHHDGYLAEATQPGSTDEWSSCRHRPSSCWPVWNESLIGPVWYSRGDVTATRRGHSQAVRTGWYNAHPQTGAHTFLRHCWQWVADESRSGSSHSPPVVCKHAATGMFRAAMIMRLMLADLTSGHVDAPRPWKPTDVLVIQGGTWDSMAEAALDEHVKHDVAAFIAVLRDLRAHDATRNVTIIYCTLPAVPAGQTTTGFRSSWAHAAANRIVVRALEAAQVNVTVLDALALTWPRHDAS